MNGHEVRAMRMAFGLSIAQWSSIISVSAPTLYRWEAQGDERLCASEESLRIVRMIDALYHGLPLPEREVLVRRVRRAVDLGGGLRALACLLQAAYPNA